MSDPVTNVEIEDVLSSIRRLVSEGEKLRDPAFQGADRQAGESVPDATSGVLELGDEHRADRGDADDVRASGADEPENGQSRDGPVRFVLTSAYRVNAEGPQDNPPTEEKPETGAWPGAAGVTGEDTGHVAAEEYSEGAGGAPAIGDFIWTAEDDPVPLDPPDQEDETVPDWVTQGQAELDALEAQLPVDPPAQADQAQAAATDAEDPPSPAAHRAGLETTIAELEAAIADTGDEWEPDGSETTPVIDWSSAGEAGVFFSSRFATGGPVEDAEIATDESEPDDEEMAEKFEAAGRHPAEDDVETPDDRLGDHLSAYLEQDEVLDEETLRNMVADIVREELQGPLGERITRNVRKLVRREINRALAEHGIE